MPFAIRFHQTGGPEVLRWEEVTVGDPAPGEARPRRRRLPADRRPRQKIGCRSRLAVLALTLGGAASDGKTGAQDAKVRPHERD